MRAQGVQDGRCQGGAAAHPARRPRGHHAARPRRPDHRAHTHAARRDPQEDRQVHRARRQLRG